MASLKRMNLADLVALGEFMGLKLDRGLTKKVILPFVEEAFKKAVSGPAPKSMAGADDTPPPPDREGEDDGDRDHDSIDDPDEEPMGPDDDADFLIHIYVAPQRRVQVHVRATDTIAVVKTHLQHMVGINRRAQRLHFLGGLRDLEDGRTVGHYNIQENEVLEMTVRGQGGGKRGRNDAPSKRLVLAQILGGIELLHGTASQEVRAEARRMDDAYRAWDFLDDMPYATLEPIVRKIMAMNYNLTERNVAEVFQPQMTAMVDVLKERISSLEKEIDLLFQQCTLSVTRLIMAEDGGCDWRAFRALLQSRLDRRLGMEAAAAAARVVIAAAAVPPA